MRQRADTGASWELAGKKKTVANNKVGDEAGLLHVHSATLCLTHPQTHTCHLGRFFEKKKLLN